MYKLQAMTGYYRLAYLYRIFQSFLFEILAAYSMFSYHVCMCLPYASCDILLLSTMLIKESVRILYI